MKTKPPPDRRKFAGTWDEIEYLYHKLLYWLYQRADPEKSRPYAERLERLLSQSDPNHEAILGEECRSLVSEAKGDLRGAIKHRENEINLIRRLHQIAYGAPHQDALLKGYGPKDLSDHLDLLATLYHDSGDLRNAISTLVESKRYCQKHGIRFDGEDVLREYLEETRDITTEVDLLIVASNGSVHAKTLPPGTLKNLPSETLKKETETGPASKPANPEETREVVRRSTEVGYWPQLSRMRHEAACS